MKIDISQIDLPIKLKQDIWYVDEESKEVAKLNVVSIQINTGSILLDCLIVDKPYRHKLKSVMVGFNLSVEQPIFETEEEAINYLDSIK